ncbi:MAG: site-specific integrase, partial [Bacteroidetes bacterium]|nr:site-specific integrase [Bacteroidota bacterium]
MQRNTYNVIFLIKRTRALRNGKLPIYARITTNGERSEFSVQQEIEEKDWDNKNYRVIGNSRAVREINDYLELVKTKINEQRVKLEERNIPITASILRDRYMGIGDKERTILEIFDEHNEKCKVLINVDYAPGTIERYCTARNHIAEFIKTNFKKNDLPLSEINQMFVTDFESFLKITKKNCHNTATKYLKNFKTIILIALANNWMNSNPFSNIRFHLDEVDMAFLTKEELEILMNKKIKLPRTQIVKDIYIFCCFTGLAFIDVKCLKYTDLEEKDGKTWVKVKRQKTKNWCSVPLLDPAMEIIEKYKTHPICEEKGVVLPVFSNQKMNSYLKEIAAACEINKNLTTHSARHTFATTVT